MLRQDLEAFSAAAAEEETAAGGEERAPARCPLCGCGYASLSLAERELHLNHCLDLAAWEDFRLRRPVVAIAGQTTIAVVAVAAAVVAVAAVATVVARVAAASISLMSPARS